MKLLMIATCFASIVCADEGDIKKMKDELEAIEDEFEAKVKKYNEALRKQHKVQTPAQEKTQEKVEKTQTLSTEEQQNAKIQDLIDQVERLTKKVTTLEQDISKTKPTENLTKDEATKKVALEDKHEIKIEPGQAQFDLALKLMIKDPSKAVESLSEIMKTHKGSNIAISAAIKIGECYLKLGKWDLSYKTFQNALEFKNITNTQQVEAYLGSAEAQFGNEDGKEACKTLIYLERSNIPMSDTQTTRYQNLIVKGHCASKMDKGQRDQIVEKADDE